MALLSRLFRCVGSSIAKGEKGRGWEGGRHQPTTVLWYVFDKYCDVLLTNTSFVSRALLAGYGPGYCYILSSLWRCDLNLYLLGI